MYITPAADPPANYCIDIFPRAYPSHAHNTGLMLMNPRPGPPLRMLVSWRAGSYPSLLDARCGAERVVAICGARGGFALLRLVAASSWKGPIPTAG